MTTKSDRLGRLAASEPSRSLRQQAWKLDATLPVLDAPCGFGRNSLFLARPGYCVVGTDNDTERVNFLERHANEILHRAKTLSLVVCDLHAEVLPFGPGAFGSVVIVHFIPSHWSMCSASSSRPQKMRNGPPRIAP